MIPSSLLEGNLYLPFLVSIRWHWRVVTLLSSARTLLRLLVDTAGTHTHRWTPRSMPFFVWQALFFPGGRSHACRGPMGLLLVYPCAHLAFQGCSSYLTPFPTLHFQAGAPLGLRVSLWPGRCGVPMDRSLQNSPKRNGERSCPR